MLLRTVQQLREFLHAARLNQLRWFSTICQATPRGRCGSPIAAAGIPAASAPRRRPARSSAPPSTPPRDPPAPIRPAPRSPPAESTDTGVIQVADNRVGRVPHRRRQHHHRQLPIMCEVSVTGAERKNSKPGLSTSSDAGVRKPGSLKSRKNSSRSTCPKASSGLTTGSGTVSATVVSAPRRGRLDRLVLVLVGLLQRLLRQLEDFRVGLIGNPILVSSSSWSSAGVISSPPSPTSSSKDSARSPPRSCPLIPAG